MIDFSRQDVLLRQDQLAFPVAIVGAGGIGSPTTYAVAKMGCTNITVFDPDRVEAHNIPNQLYGPDDVGLHKVDALAAFVLKQTGTRIRAVAGRAPLERYRGVVVSAVDTMAARAELWNRSIRHSPSTDLFIDARMGGEVGRIYAIRPVDPDDVRLYERTLYDDEAADPDPCSQQAVIYSVFVLGGLVAGQIRRFAVGDPVVSEFIFDLATMTFLASPGPLA